MLHMGMKPRMAAVLLLVLLTVVQLRNARHDRKLSKGGSDATSLLPVPRCEIFLAMQLSRDGPKDPPILRLSSYQRPQQGQHPTKQGVCHAPHLPRHAGSPDRVKLSLHDGPLWDTVFFVQVFLEGVKAALTADAKYNGGDYSPDDKPIVGLKAFGRVYAGELS